MLKMDLRQIEEEAAGESSRLYPQITKFEIVHNNEEQFQKQAQQQQEYNDNKLPIADNNHHYRIQSYNEVCIY